MKILVEQLRLTPRHPFTIARGTTRFVRNLLVRVRRRGIEGWGEAAPSGYYGQTAGSAAAALRAAAKLIEKAGLFDVEGVTDEFQHRRPKETAAAAALNAALFDLQGKELGVPLWRLWGLNRRRVPRTSFTLGLAAPADLERKIAEAKRFPIFKLKLGRPNDLELLRLVNRLAPKKTLRVDANCGWTVRETVAKARGLEKLGVEFLEQPIPPGDPRALKRIKDRIGIPLFADESVVVAEDVPPLRGCVDGVNIKLVKCGGLSAARRMIAVARACGMRVMLGCMLESSLGITAAAQLAPEADFLDLDGHLLLAADPFRGATLDKDFRLRPPARPGLGVVSRRQ